MMTTFFQAHIHWLVRTFSLITFKNNQARYQDCFTRNSFYPKVSVVRHKRHVTSLLPINYCQAVPTVAFFNALDYFWRFVSFLSLLKYSSRLKPLFMTQPVTLHTFAETLSSSTMEGKDYRTSLRI